MQKKDNKYKVRSLQWAKTGDCSCGLLALAVSLSMALDSNFRRSID